MTKSVSNTSLIQEVNATEIPFGTGAFWWLGQHGFIIKLGQDVVLIDAYLSPSEWRNVPPVVMAEEVNNANVIIGTHDHSDHIDRPAWPTLASASPKATFITPKQARDEILKETTLPSDRVLGINDGETLRVGKLSITAIPAAHEHLSIDPETGFHEFIGVIIEGNGLTVYHAGDTCIYEGMQARLRNWSLDLALLPINGRDAKRLKSGCIGNMTYQEAVDLAGTIRPGLTIPTHFEMFTGNTENPELFLDYLSVKYPLLRAEIPIHGRRVIFPKGQ